MKIKCIKCGESIPININDKDTLEGVTVTCKCGCIQTCLGEDGEISRWRVINPFSK